MTNKNTIMAELELESSIADIEDQEREEHRIRSWGMQSNKRAREEILNKQLPTAEQLVRSI